MNQMTWGEGHDEVLGKGLTVQGIPEANLSVLDLQMGFQVTPRQFYVMHGTLCHRELVVRGGGSSPTLGLRIGESHLDGDWQQRWQWQHDLEDTMHLRIEGQAPRGRHG
jgi:hypothetical protein